QACLTLSGESPEGAMGVMLLADCRLAFGEDDVIRSIDLVARLIADPERPWAEYNRGKPITQRQVAKLLGTFGIISVNVRPKVGPQGKGFRRIDFEEAWASYCPDQTSSRTDSDISIRPTVPRPLDSAQVDGFASRSSLGRIEKWQHVQQPCRLGRWDAKRTAEPCAQRFRHDWDPLG